MAALNGKLAVIREQLANYLQTPVYGIVHGGVTNILNTIYNKIYILERRINLDLSIFLPSSTRERGTGSWHEIIIPEIRYESVSTDVTNYRETNVRTGRFRRDY